jgi:hypothetical protein
MASLSGGQERRSSGPRTAAGQWASDGDHEGKSALLIQQQCHEMKGGIYGSGTPIDVLK